MVTKADIESNLIEDGDKVYPDPKQGTREWTRLVKIDDMKIDNHPLTTWKIDKDEDSRVSDEYLAWSGYYGFIETDQPEYDIKTQKVVESDWLVDDENHEVIQQWSVVNLTEEEINQLIEDKWKEIRKLRTQFLRETDWTQLPDVDIPKETVQAYKDFRKSLRDITKQSDDPFEIEMPVMD